MTANDFIRAGIPIDDTSTALLCAESAIDWIELNTIIDVDRTNLSSLPAGAKMFIVKYGEIMSNNATVASESLGGMSQSYNTAARNSLLYDTALSLLENYMKSLVEFTASQSRWD